MLEAKVRLNKQKGEARKLAVRMIATLAATATAPASSVYAYYEPQLKKLPPAVRFTVR